MQVVNYTEFRRSMKTKLDQVSDDGDTVIVNHGGNKNVVINYFAAGDQFVAGNVAFTPLGRESKPIDQCA